MNETTACSLPFREIHPLPMVTFQKCQKVIDKSLKICYSDMAIIDGIKVRNIRITNYLYEKFYAQIGYMVISNSGTKMDAEDLFQDALMVIYQKISKERLELMSSFYTYLYSICWHLWLQQLHKRGFKYQYKGISDLEAWEDEMKIKEMIEESEKYNLFQEHFLRLSQAGQKVLRLYMSDVSAKEVAKLMGYKSDNYAKLRKFIYKEKLKDSIINDPRFKNLCRS
jgi:RNA polymerase sigma factor (sigma-70 family)